MNRWDMGWRVVYPLDRVKGTLVDLDNKKGGT